MTLLSRVLHPHIERPAKTPSRKSTPGSPRIDAARKGKDAIQLSIALESPAIVLYGHAHESTGSIISGVLSLDVLPVSQPQSPLALAPQVSTGALSTSGASFSALSLSKSAPQLPPSSPPSPPLHPSQSNDLNSDSAQSVSDDVDVDSVQLQLVQTMHYTKPFLAPSSSISSCKSCTTRRVTLAQWDVLSQTCAFPVGSHAYPFSHLIPGSVAASTKLGSDHCHSYIKYDLVAVARAAGRETSVVLPVNVSRSILRGPDRNSFRVFPPTEVTASAVLPGVMYPKSKFPIELRLGHVVSSKSDRRWRMRKLSWKLEEHVQVAASACDRHKQKLESLVEAQRKAQLYKSLRSGNPGSPGTASDGPSKSNGMHHSTVQTSMFLSLPPADPSANVRAAEPAQAEPEVQGNQDTVEPEEEAPTNRVSDEVAHFAEDFGIGSAQSSSPSNPEPSSPAPSASKEELFLDELRVVAHGEIKSGWKSDFSGEGSIELVAEISALNCSSGSTRPSTKASSKDPKPDDLQEGLRGDANISCDISDPNLGVYVGHVLVLEVIVAEEVVQPMKTNLHKETLTPVTSANSISSNSQVGVPTGSARVLRMQFKVIVTERSGLGIAWDDEVPPTYEAVKALSPPTYDSPADAMANLSSSSMRPTPHVLYGLGDTPVVGSFMPRSVSSIDQIADLDDHVQEFRL